MSGKVVLAASLAIVAGVISVVHWQQTKEKTDMKKGIERDKARTAQKKANNGIS
jgi:hypothetical protein